MIGRSHSTSLTWIALAALTAALLLGLFSPAAATPSMEGGRSPMPGDAAVPLALMPPGSSASPLPSEEIFPPQTLAIRFNHKKHVKDFQLTCKVCHAAAYGSEADEVSRDQARFLDLTASEYDALKRRILDNWDAVQAIAAQVPPAGEVARLLETAGGPSRVDQIGISTEERDMAIADAHYLRDRFTVRKLSRMLGI